MKNYASILFVVDALGIIFSYVNICLSRSRQALILSTGLLVLFGWLAIGDLWAITLRPPPGFIKILYSDPVRPLMLRPLLVLTLIAACAWQRWPDKNSKKQG